MQLTIYARPETTYLFNAWKAHGGVWIRLDSKHKSVLAGAVKDLNIQIVDPVTKERIRTLLIPDADYRIPSIPSGRVTQCRR